MRSHRRLLLVGGATLRYSYIPRLQSETIPTLVIADDVAKAASGS